LGEHTETVLGEIGYSAGQIAELRAAGALGNQ
jgi:crotonobetainyl-CoA:carnitine CoA-transferase CaiB-like acyl-CoA transferase